MGASEAILGPNEPAPRPHRYVRDRSLFCMTAPNLRIVRKAPTPDAASFFLIVADHDQRFFCVEGPMTDDRPWQNAARHARDQFGSRIVCGPQPARIETRSPPNFSAPKNLPAFRLGAS
jgi:hypothetical protein